MTAISPVPAAIECPYCRTLIPHHEVVAGQIDRCRCCGNTFRRPGKAWPEAEPAIGVAIPSQGKGCTQWRATEHEQVDSSHVLEAELRRPTAPHNFDLPELWSGDTQISSTTSMDNDTPVPPQNAEPFELSAEPKAEDTDLARRSRPWLVSMLTHVGIILALGLCVIAVERREQIELTASWDGDLDAELDTSPIEVVELDTSALEELAVQGDEILRLPELQSPELTVNTDIHLDGNKPDVPSVPSIPSNEAAGGPKSQFFGVEAAGHHFVFVVDMSSSMEGPRFERAVAELKRSIGEFNTEQKYFINFYNYQPYPMPESGLVAATPQQIQRTFAWLDSVHPFGSTWPTKALVQAIELRPDAIFLLSDGDFIFSAVDDVLAARRRAECEVPVHTIGFESKAGERILKTIAERTGGTHRFVP